MPLANERIKYLLERWTSRKATPEDERELFSALSDDLPEQPFQEHIQQLVNDYDKSKLSPAVDWDLLFEEIIKNRKGSEPAYIQSQIKYHWQRWLYIAAAAIIILLTAGIYFFPWQRPPAPSHTATILPVKDSIRGLPGGDKATLTLSDGRVVKLEHGDSSIDDAGVTIKNQDGELRYDEPAAIGYNTMTTPRGGQYRLLLSDGSKVWLNASSSITYPTAFTTKTRNVSITGEVYFEVEKDKTKPFIVLTPKDSITVLGTSFNVNTYNDEPAPVTTLLEGSVKIAGSILRPGEAYRAGKIMKADVEQAVAWKNNIFNFNGLDLPGAMRQLARWYNLEVRFEGGIPDKKIRGEMGRDLNLSQVIKILEKMELNFRLEQNKLVVTP